MSASHDQDVVVDVARSRISDFWKLEDYWAIWLGFVILLVAFICFASDGPRADAEKQLAPHLAVLKAEQARAPFKTIAWHNANDKKAGVQTRRNPAGRFFGEYLGTPRGWATNVMESFYLSGDDAKARSDKATDAFNKAKAATAAALATAQAAEQAAADAQFADAKLNDAANGVIEKWQTAVKGEARARDRAAVRGYNLFTPLPLLCLALGLLFAIWIKCMGGHVPKFLRGFVGVFLVAVLAQCIGNQSQMRYYGVSAEAWAIILGMLMANTLGTPEWLKPGLNVEYYIKTGLVLLGAEILLSKILAIGIPGIFVAWVVTPIVLIVTFIFGQKVLKMESATLNVTISADMSVCGTSAAIATAAACRAKREELTLAIGISLAFTATMMIVMPMGIKALGINPVLGGAWIGGVVDSTGAVTAAGAFLGQTGMAVAATVKMIQNVLIGFTAFAVAVYWVTVVDRQVGVPINPFEIWHRFPKFVIGFLLASVLFSTLGGSYGADVANATIDQGVIRGLSGGLRGWFFVLAFSAIGLSTDFRVLAKYFKGGKPVILYVFGQSFNGFLTLAMAYVMFHLVFPEITQSLLQGALN
ncbi:MAG: YeiH family protein [Deltaproteobacteria bacterium]|jgi:uncharacterized membrane protein YadS|nr:YeiH family protein [Deltaproteobacteria bacterium]